MARFINCASYNLRGLQQGQQQLLELCVQHDIIAVQEHWLADCDIGKISNIHNDFRVLAKSAMTVVLPATSRLVDYSRLEK